ncbi:MAG: hypothetical protein ACFFBD_19330, partial [Candidatus Hodarchaeota archaeon]
RKKNIEMISKAVLGQKMHERNPNWKEDYGLSKRNALSTVVQRITNIVTTTTKNGTEYIAFRDTSTKTTKTVELLLEAIQELTIQDKCPTLQSIRL